MPYWNTSSTTSLTATFIAFALAGWPFIAHGQRRPPMPEDAQTPAKSSTANERPGADSAADSAPAESVEVAPIEVDARRDGPAAARGVRRLTSADPTAAEADRALYDSAFVTVVDIDERAGELTSVAEILSESTGVNVRSLGGLGSFASLSVRGAASGNTTIAVDGIPLSRIASTSADVGRLAPDTFDQLQIYRGAVPVGLGASALGGALDLSTALGRPASQRPWTVAMGGGSFRTRHTRVRWLDSSADGRTDYHVSAGYRGTDGGFRFYDDKGTNLLITDDEMVTRRNNHDDQLDALARIRHQLGAFTVVGGSRSFYRKQGLPGPGSVQARSAGATTVGQILDASVDKRQLWGSPRLFGQGALFASVEWQHYQDRDGEVRLGVQDSRQYWLSTGARGRVSLDAGDSHLLTIGLDSRFELAGYRDALGDGRAEGQGWRTGGAVALADEIALGRADWLAVAPAVRADWLYTVPLGDANQPVVGDEALTPRSDVFLSPRLSARATVRTGLAIKGSVGYYMREPTVPELFGGRGVQVGNPALRVENGVSSDVGAALAPAGAVGPIDRIFVESALFWRRPRDTIVYRAALGGSFNQGDTDMRGLEVRATARLARTATLTVNYTYLRTRQDSPLPSYDGKPLPHAPAHQLYARLDVARTIRGNVAVLWTDLAFSTGNYLDLAGLSEVPARRLVGAGIKIEPLADLLVGIEGKNLLDSVVDSVALDPPPNPELTRVPRAVADFYGFPLPGRAFYLTLEWKR